MTDTVLSRICAAILRRDSSFPRTVWSCTLRSANAQAESLRYKLLGGLAVSRGKLRAQRAKSMKFKDRCMISSGQPVKEYIDFVVRHVLLRQGVLGIKVTIMLDWDSKGKQGPMTPLPDLVTIHPPKEEETFRSTLVPTGVQVEA